MGSFTKVKVTSRGTPQSTRLFIDGVEIHDVSLIEYVQTACKQPEITIVIRGRLELEIEQPKILLMATPDEYELALAVAAMMNSCNNCVGIVFNGYAYEAIVEENPPLFSIDGPMSTIEQPVCKLSDIHQLASFVITDNKLTEKLDSNDIYFYLDRPSGTMRAMLTLRRGVVDSCKKEDKICQNRFSLLEP